MIIGKSRPLAASMSRSPRPGHVKTVLGDGRAADDLRQTDPDDREDRDQRIAEGVADDRRCGWAGPSTQPS